MATIKKIFLCATLFVGLQQAYGQGVTDTSNSPYVQLRSIPMTDVKWTDGYISVNRTGQERFKQVGDHETYNMGHLMTAACVHHRATGKTNFLDIAIKAGDCLVATFPDESQHFLGYSSIMGLVSLYRTTGEQKYLDMAERFINMQGTGDTASRRKLQKGVGTDQMQDRVPFREETRAVGHAVFGTYLYTGVANVVAETGEPELAAALDRIWGSVAHKRMDITGAVGYGHLVSERGDRVHEAFGPEYGLPNLYNETCSGIGWGMLNWVLLLLPAECGANHRQAA